MAATLLLLKNPQNVKAKKNKPAPMAQLSVAGVLGQSPYNGISATLGWCITAQANANSSTHNSKVIPTSFRGLIGLVSLNVWCLLMPPKLKLEKLVYVPPASFENARPDGKGKQAESGVN